MTAIKRRCKKCGKVIIQWRKGEVEPSRIIQGAKIALHLLECDRELFDEILEEEFNTSLSDKSK